MQAMAGLIYALEIISLLVFGAGNGIFCVLLDHLSGGSTFLAPALTVARAVEAFVGKGG
mgnify:CR=1 FL=1